MMMQTPGLVDANDGRGLALTAITRDQSLASNRIALDETAETEARDAHGVPASNRSAEMRKAAAFIRHWTLFILFSPFFVREAPSR